MSKAFTKPRPKPRRYREYDYEFRTRSRVTERSLAAEYEELFGRLYPVFTLENEEAISYIRAMTVYPTAERMYAIDDFIGTAKTKTYWTKLDWLSLVAAHDAQAGRVNVKNPTEVATAVGGPVFTEDKGYTGSATSYLTTGINLTTESNYLRDSAHIGVWNYNSNSINGMGAHQEVSAGNAQFYSAYANLIFMSANSSQFQTGTTTSLGHIGFSRTGATTTSVFRHGTPFTTTATASAAVTATPVLFGRSPRACAAMHYGSGLTDAEWLELHDDLGDYFNASGIIPVYDVFLIIGDSNNHQGIGYSSLIDQSDPDVWAHRDYTPGSGSGEEPIREVSPQWYSTGYVGYDVAFFRDFYIPNGELADGRKVLIIKASGGGTGLFTGPQEWRVGDSSYSGAVRLANEVMATYPGAEFKAIFGCIGANDATVSANADLWVVQFDAMLAGMRSEITGASAAKIVMTGIPPTYLGIGTAAGIQAKIAAVGSRLTDAAYANPSLPTVINDNADTVHYSAIGHRGVSGSGGLAGRFWTAWQTLA